jgi:hypothetical protein
MPGGSMRWFVPGVGRGSLTPDDRGEPCPLHSHPARSPNHHQPDKPALFRGSAVEGGAGCPGDRPCRCRREDGRLRRPPAGLALSS